MQKNNLSMLLLLCFLFVSCAASKEIKLSEDILKEDMQFSLSEKNELTGKIGKRIFKFSNLAKLIKQEKFWYAYFNIDDNDKEQILIVYNLESSGYDWCKFYPETSYLFEDELICFSIQIEPDKYPLDKSYEIVTLIKDFKNSIQKEFVEESRYDLSMINGVQDFYYRKPRFLLANNTDINTNVLSAVDSKYTESDKIFYVLWEQAHFPISSYYYDSIRKKINSACAYPPLDDPKLYRTVEEEFIPIELTNQNSDIIQLNKDESLISSANYDGYDVYIIKTGEKEIDYTNLLIRIVEGQNVTDYTLDNLFLYQDKLENIELAQGKDGAACFIITTNIFSYDLYIDLISRNSDVYLRASSFPIENRALE